MKHQLLIVLSSVLLSAAGCKDEAPKQQPPTTKDSTLPQSSPEPYPPVDTELDSEIETGPENEDSDNCSKSTEPDITASPVGSSSNSVNFVPNTSINISFSAEDSDNCEFTVYKIDADNLPSGVLVDGNESRSVRLSGTLFQSSSSVTTGSVTVYARNMTACAKAFSKTDCGEFSSSGGNDYDSYDNRKIFSWTIGNGNQGLVTGNSSGSNPLMIGLGLFTSLLGGGNPLSALLSGLTGGSLIGGGLNNQQIPGNQLGITSPINGTVSCSQLNQTQCQQNQQCMLQGVSCVQRTNTTSCTSILDETQCRNASCIWTLNRCSQQ